MRQKVFLFLSCEFKVQNVVNVDGGEDKRGRAINKSVVGKTDNKE